MFLCVRFNNNNNAFQYIKHGIFSKNKLTVYYLSISIGLIVSLWNSCNTYFWPFHNNHHHDLLLGVIAPKVFTNEFYTEIFHNVIHVIQPAWHS